MVSSCARNSSVEWNLTPISQDMDLAERDVFSFDGERCDRIVAYVLSRVGRLP